jgi:hypothetical protein
MEKQKEKPCGITGLFCTLNRKYACAADDTWCRASRVCGSPVRQFVNAGELQANIDVRKPGNFTGKLLMELSIHSYNAFIAYTKIQQRPVGSHQRTAKRYIPDHGRVIPASLTQDAFLFAIDPYVMPVLFHGIPQLSMKLIYR